MFDRINDFYDPFIQWAKESGRSRITIKEYQRMFDGPLRDIGKKRLRTLHLTDLSSVIESGGSFGKYGTEKAMVTIRLLFRYIKDSGTTIPFDWRDIRCSKVPRNDVQYLTQTEIGKLRSVIDTDTDNGLRTRAMFELLLHTGLRIGEGVSLNRKDIDLERKELSVTNGKNGKRQSVFLTDQSIFWIKEYLRSRTDDNPFLFVSVKAKQLPKSTARADLTKYENMSGIEKHVHWHILRKTFVTNLLFGGVDIKTTQYLARHESEVTTLRHYAAINHENARSAMINVMDRV